MKSLLITAIAGDIAQSIALIVRETFPEWRILGTDIHERHGAELYVDRWFQAPPASSLDFKNWLEDLIRREKIDVCLPMSEAELLFFAQTDIKNVAGAKLVMPSAQTIIVGTDKLSTARFLASSGCPTPWTMPVHECHPSVPFPCIFKPRRSAGSKGVFVCHNEKEAQFFGELYPLGILQELLLPEDQEVTCAIYKALDGRIAILQLLRKLVGGLTGWARVIDNPEIRSQCELLANSLDLRGSINVQLRITQQGPRIFEINPRFSSTVLIRHHMGFQDVVWTLRELLGEPIKLVSPSVGVTAVRTQGAEILP